MPISKEKSSAYLRYRKEQSLKTYSKINQETGVPMATISAYFNGTVQSPNVDTFLSLAACVGGSWEDYDAWQPDPAPIKQQEDSPGMNVSEIVAHIRQTYADSAARTEAAYQAAIAASHKVARIQRIEKYVLFVMLIAVSVYAVFAFTHYDLPDPTSGLTSLLP